jgi:PAS domain S-box-containing protein
MPKPTVPALTSRSEEQLRLLVEAVRDYAIFTLDPDGRVTSWNGGAERMKGYHRDEILGQHFSRFYPEADLAAGKPAWGLEVAAAEGRFEDEGWRVRRDGSLFWANVVITALRNRTGLLVGFGKVTRDLTERKRAEDEVRRLNADLERRVVERTEGLVVLNRSLDEAVMRAEAARAEAEASAARASAALEARDAFFARASHELRTPLTSAIGSVRLARRALDRALPESPETLLAVAVRSLDAIAAITNDLLDIARLSSGAGALALEPVPAARLVEEAVDTVRADARERAVGLRVEVPPDLVVRVDPLRFGQALVNLLGNALRFTPAGGEVRVTAAAAAGEATIRVEDTGEGIATEDLERVFEPFVQVGRQPTGTRATGLGLSIVRHVVTLHGGRVRAESGGPGRGSAFVVTLPLPG